MFRSVDSPHYHLWTDALHARYLARNAQNAWDLGTYVRWTVSSAWTAFEATCEEVLKTDRLGSEFELRFDLAADAGGIPPPDWGRGLWQKVSTAYEWRKEYVHRGLSQGRLFAPLSEADESISVIRAAVKDLYRLAGLTSPEWVNDDANPVEPGSVTHLTALYPGADQNDPTRILVTYMYRGTEHEWAVLPSGTDPTVKMVELLHRFLVPISAVRAYRGDELLDEWEVKSRGS
jgi:hypothetical protein